MKTQWLKQILAWLITATLLLCCLPMGALADDSPVVDGLKDAAYTDAKHLILATAYDGAGGEMTDNVTDTVIKMWYTWDDTYNYVYVEVTEPYNTSGATIDVVYYKNTLAGIDGSAIFRQAGAGYVQYTVGSGAYTSDSSAMPPAAVARKADSTLTTRNYEFSFARDRSATGFVLSPVVYVNADYLVAYGDYYNGALSCMKQVVYQNESTWYEKKVPEGFDQVDAQVIAAVEAKMAQLPADIAALTLAEHRQLVEEIGDMLDDMPLSWRKELVADLLARFEAADARMTALLEEEYADDAQALAQAIAALPEEITLAHEQAVRSAQAAANAMGEMIRLVDQTLLNKLTASVNRMNELTTLVKLDGVKDASYTEEKALLLERAYVGNGDLLRDNFRGTGIKAQYIWDDNMVYVYMEVWGPTCADSLDLLYYTMDGSDESPRMYNAPTGGYVQFTASTATVKENLPEGVLAAGRVVSGLRCYEIAIPRAAGATGFRLSPLAYYDAEYTVSYHSAYFETAVAKLISYEDASTWYEEKGDPLMDQQPPMEDYAYTIALVGDTQKVTRHNPDNLSSIYDYLVDNAKRMNLQFVCGLGDITDLPQAAEWQVAYEQIHKLDGVVPYSLVFGNHDYPDWYNRYFPLSDYRDTIGGSYDGTMENTWQTFRVGEIDYLVIALGYYGFSDDIFAWADRVIKDHPYHNVIVTSHCYLGRDGNPVDSTGPATPIYDGMENNGIDLWMEVVYENPNVVMVVSGHVACTEVLATEVIGKNGNKVMQLLVNPQFQDAYYPGGLGTVALLHFSQDGKTVQVENYSAIHKKWFLPESQFTFELNVIKGSGQPLPAPAYGDVNGDDAVDAKDALLILQAAVDKAELTREQTAVADVNGDSAIDAKDALLVLQKAVDMIEKFPVEP